MGHVRLGILPATRKWIEVVKLLDSGNFSARELAEAAANAANDTLKKAVNDPAFVEIYKVLCELPRAAKEQDFSAALAKLGIDVGTSPSLTDIAQALSQKFDSIIADKNHKRTDLAEMAKQTAISSFLEKAEESSAQLWAPTNEDIRHGIGKLAAPERHGDFAQHFFTGLTQKILGYFLERELPRHISPSGPFHSIQDMRTFQKALENHCRESSFIMRPFAKAKSTTAPATAAAKDARLSGTIKLASALAARAAPEDTVFVLARPAQGSRMPLAAVRVKVKDLPLKFSFDDSMAMSAGAKLSDFAEVVVAARVSKSGNVVPERGDLEGVSKPVRPGTTGMSVEIAKEIQ